MYKKQADIRSNHAVIIIMAVIIAVLAILWLNKPHTNSPDHVQNIVTLEYYRNYTVQRTNGKVDTLWLDLKVYAYTDCDRLTNNDEGHNCEINDAIKIWEELNILGYN